MSDRERPKKSWREVDAGRNRSGGGSSAGGTGGGGGNMSDRASKQHRAALEELFTKGDIGKVADQIAAAQAPARPAEPARPALPPPLATADADDGESRVALRKKVVEAIGKSEITRALDRYLKAHPMPDDFEVLEQALESTRDDRVLEALAILERLLGRERPKRSRTLAGRLRTLEETSDEGDLRVRAAAVRAKLG